MTVTARMDLAALRDVSGQPLVTTELLRVLANSGSVAAVTAVYTAAGPGESTTDLAWDGQAGVFEHLAHLIDTRLQSEAEEDRAVGSHGTNSVRDEQRSDK